MSEPLDLFEELRRYNPEPVPFDRLGVVYNDKTPVHTFTTVVIPLDHWGYGALMARDAYNPELAGDLIKFLRSNAHQVDLLTPARLVKGFHSAGTGFDSVLLLGPTAHRLFQNVNARLHDLTLQAIPTYTGEFSGNEKAELIDLIRKDVVPTLDWKREPSPQVFLRFKDAVTGVRSTGKKPGLTTRETLLKLLKEMKPAEGSFAEVTNFRGETATLTPVPDGFDVALGPETPELSLSRGDVVNWVDKFLTRGQDSAR
jgi:hypothetical protein